MDSIMLAVRVAWLLSLLPFWPCEYAVGTRLASKTLAAVMADFILNELLRRGEEGWRGSNVNIPTWAARGSLVPIQSSL